jgi:hypothetical protein
MARFHRVGSQPPQAVSFATGFTAFLALALRGPRVGSGATSSLLRPTPRPDTQIAERGAGPAYEGGDRRLTFHRSGLYRRLAPAIDWMTRMLQPAAATAAPPGASSGDLGYSCGRSTEGPEPAAWVAVRVWRTARSVARVADVAQNLTATPSD